MMAHSFDLQPLTLDAIPELIALHHAVGWHAPPDFLATQMKLFLTIGHLFGHRDQGRLITCAGVYPYSLQLASIGPVIVHPDYQRQGLGQQLMTCCLQACPDPVSTVMLISTAVGQRLYRSLGFETVGDIRRMVFEAGSHPIHVENTMRPIQQIDLPSIIAADHIAIGVDRSAFYRNHFANIACGFLIDTEQRLPSFGIATKRGDVLQIGPLIAADLRDALQIIDQFLATGNSTLRIDVPAEQKGFLDALQQLGFIETLRSPLMTRGGSALPGRREYLYGIADPALG